MDKFPNIEQYTIDELKKLIELALAILNAHKQSNTPLSSSHRWQTYQIA